MADWPNDRYVAPPILTPFNLEAQGFSAIGAGSLNNATSQAWPTSNKALFWPFRLNTFEVAYQLLWFVGATSSGNIDVGIYDSQKNLIVSAGSTAMSATVNTWQELNITDTPLPPGDYLLAAACSTTSGTVISVAITDEQALTYNPIYQQTSALALPDPCVPVACTDASPLRAAIGIQLVPTF